MIRAWTAGMVVGAGSDSTVTPLDPFLQMKALRAHHLEGESISGELALILHTIGGHAAARQDRSTARVVGRTQDPPRVARMVGRPSVPMMLIARLGKMS